MANYSITDRITLSKNEVISNQEKKRYQTDTTKQFLKEVYKELEMGYSKFFKMDVLCKASLIATEFLVRNNNISEKYNEEEIALVMANQSSSLDTDLKHQESISDENAYFPSPSIFVYTLPNILLGEICIKYKWQGEQIFFLQEQLDAFFMMDYVHQLFENTPTKACVLGWVDYLEEKLDVKMVLIEKTAEGIPFNVDNIDCFFNSNN